uniref:Uncharacterized protein n=1 Tax=OCS116 cluster bacterium TaxID=2030921 RepID=A0A2A4YUL2_9PROT
MKTSILFVKNLFAIIMFLIGLSGACFADSTDYWSKNKTMKFPGEVATTSCVYFNEINVTSPDKVLINEFYVRWLEGWVSGFVMYADWDIRTIERQEYIEWFKVYCSKFPENSLGMAAHAFAFRVKKENSVNTVELQSNHANTQIAQNVKPDKFANARKAYNEGRMNDKQHSAYERLVESGDILAQVKQAAPHVKIAPRSLFNAYNNGQLSPEQRTTVDNALQDGRLIMPGAADRTLGKGLYSCVIKDARQVSNNGNFEMDNLAKYKLGQRFAINIMTGKMTGFLASGWQTTGSIEVLDFGSNEQAFKAIAVSKPNVHVQYLEINEYANQEKKPFKITSYLDILSGLCEKLE